MKEQFPITQRKLLCQRLVGFELPAAFSRPPPKESHLVIRKGEIVGHVTIVAFSETLGYIIDMDFAQPDMARRPH